MTAIEGRRLGVKGWSKKEKGFMDMGNRVVIAGLFTITKIWKQPKCPSLDEWIKQLWDIYTMEYYSAIKKEENSTFCNIMDGPGEHYAE